MKHVALVVLVAIACGCGTVRYRVNSPTDGRRVQTEVQWDVVEIKFNKMWVDGLTEMWDNAWH